VITKKSTVIIILGPSAAGKSDIALSLAKELKTAIISSDAMQIYRGMNIGTDKPSVESQRAVKHYLIDVVGPEEDFDVARFKKLAEEAIERIILDGKIPLIVGGTGLYIKALTRGICRAPFKNKQIRKDLEKLAQTKGKQFLYERLAKVDSEAARRIHPNDQRRVIRALEVYEQSGIPITRLQTQNQHPEPKFNFIKIGVIRPREELYKRGEERVEKMFKEGWIEEVKTLLDKGYQPELVSMHGLGYREITRFLAGKLTLTETKSLIKRNTRRLIKRQITWFKKERDINWLPIEKNQSKEMILSKIKKILAQEGVSGN